MVIMMNQRPTSNYMMNEPYTIHHSSIHLDSIDSEAMDAMMSPEESGLRRSKPRYLLPTSSFMAHINSRRESKIVLNGK